MNRRVQPWLGTLVEITANGSHAAIDAAFAAVALAHRLMSFHDPASDVSRLNRAVVGDVVQVHEHTWKVLMLAEQIGDASQGMFNLACAPQLVSWGCLPAPSGERPTYQPSQAVLRCEGGYTVRKLKPGWIDTGGIAKGYAVDLAVETLRMAGATSACVNAGGDLRALGEEAWPVVVRDPRAPQRVHTRLWLRDQALATSACYFSGRSVGERRVSALIDGRNGQAVVSERSVSVYAPLCATADALTKVVMASGDPNHPALTLGQATAFII